MIENKPYKPPHRHMHAVRTTADGPALAYVPSHVLEDRTAMLELRDALVQYIDTTRPAASASLMPSK